MMILYTLLNFFYMKGLIDFEAATIDTVDGVATVLKSISKNYI